MRLTLVAVLRRLSCWATLSAHRLDRDAVNAAKAAHPSQFSPPLVEQIDDPAERRRMSVESKRIIDRVFGGGS